MCLSHIWYSLLAYCVLYGNWVLDECDEYIICSTNRFIQITLEFKKRLVYKRFFSKYTKLLKWLQWPARKHCTKFISANSNLVFLTCSFLSDKSDPLVYVNLVFWKELNKYLLYFFLKSLFFAMLGFLFTLLCCWNCPLHIIKKFYNLDNNFATESILENCIQTVHVLVGETESIQFL